MSSITLTAIELPISMRAWRSGMPSKFKRLGCMAMKRRSSSRDVRRPCVVDQKPPCPARER
eukprot:54300-Alexandrium_andersonii.AAC.1